jgi:UDP-GlcNAc:undecaprenyl-phosphate GlcNAc-1-phosphate transferase
MTYTSTFLISFLISVFLTPVFRLIAIKFKILDHPVSEIKTHKEPTPYLGGLAIACSFFITLLLVRLTTNFPTGTLRSLRGIILGSIIILLIGLIDDLKYKGIHFTIKFLGEIIAAFVAIFYNIRIEFIKPEWFSIVLTLIWIVGITNAVNLIDVIDGLSSGVCIIACLGFYFILGFIEEEIYVSYAVISLAAALLGFMPYNLSKKFKIFMGDTGALFTGFVLSTVALGAKYSSNNILGVLSPIVVLLIPIYETFFISILRLNRGQSPFLGSKDHFALRLETIGIRRNKILLITYLVGILFSISSVLIVASQNIFIPVVILLIISIFIISITKFLTKINI